MQFRPCVDILNGQIKQIVGSSLATSFKIQENFISQKNADYYAKIYKTNSLYGGHIIMLDQTEETKQQALLALKAYPKALQIGGGINLTNAKDFLKAGANKIIITSYIFTKNKLNIKNLKRISKIIGKEKLVLDLSCKKSNNNYYVSNNKWRDLTDLIINQENFDLLTKYCSEFLVHSVDVEGKRNGIDKKLLELLAKLNTKPITYAGGIRNVKDIEKIKNIGKNKINFTVGSALDLFGGKIKYKEIIKKYVN